MNRESNSNRTKVNIKVIAKQDEQMQKNKDIISIGNEQPTIHHKEEVCFEFDQI